MGRTVQKVIETAIFKATGENIMINGSSRTDAGVHAREMIANFLLIVQYQERSLEKL